MKKVIIIIAAVLLIASYAVAKVGFDLGLTLGSGTVTVTGPVSGDVFLLVNGTDSFLLANGADKLELN